MLCFGADIGSVTVFDLTAVEQYTASPGIGDEDNDDVNDVKLILSWDNLSASLSVGNQGCGCASASSMTKTSSW